MNTPLADLKARAIARIDEQSDHLAELALDIHANPELAFNEHRSAGLLIEALRSDRFDVSAGTGGLETAFSAEYGSADQPGVAILAEYDALPGPGPPRRHHLLRP